MKSASSLSTKKNSINLYLSNRTKPLDINSNLPEPNRGNSRKNLRQKKLSQKSALRNTQNFIEQLTNTHSRSKY